MALGITIREFARRDGCNDKLVRRAISSGFLKTLADGTLDPALVGSGWRKTNRNADKGADTGADSAQNVRTSKVSAPDGDNVHVELEAQPHGGALKRGRKDGDDGEGDDDLPDIEGAIQRLMSGEVFSQAVAEKLKTNGLALRQLVNARREAGALVEIELAERILFEKGRELRDAILNWPIRVAPLLVADLDVPAEKLAEVLQEHVHQLLAELGEPEVDFSA